MRILLYIGTSTGLAIYRAALDANPPQRMALLLPNHDIRAVEATDAETLAVAVAGQPPQQSFDGGQTWSVAASAPLPIGKLVQTRHGPLAPANPRLSGATAYARVATRPPVLLGAGAGGMQLFLSDDDGIHWKPVGLRGTLQGRVVALAPDPGMLRRAWAISDGGTILRSDDAGQSWQALAQAPERMCCLAVVADAGDMQP